MFRSIARIYSCKSINCSREYVSISGCLREVLHYNMPEVSRQLHTSKLLFRTVVMTSLVMTEGIITVKIIPKRYVLNITTTMIWNKSWCHTDDDNTKNTVAHVREGSDVFVRSTPVQYWQKGNFLP